MHIAESTLHVPAPSRVSAYLDWLQMLTGVALIIFIWCHLAMTSSILLGPGVMDALGRFLEDTYMAQLGGPVIGFVFLLHFVLAARKLPFRVAEQKTIWVHARTMRHRDTWLWVIQAATAMIILLLGAIHMWVVLTDLPIEAAKSAAFLTNGWWLLFFLVLLFTVGLHMGIGFYRIAVKWGFSVRANRARYLRLTLYLIGIYIIIGLLTLLRTLLLAV